MGYYLDKETIEAAGKAYDEMTDEQKKRVPADKLKKLTDAEKALAEIEKKPQILQWRRRKQQILQWQRRKQQILQCHASADYKNSDEYNAIKTTLTELSKVNKDTPIEDINSLYANLGKAANDYLKAKDAQVRLFPSKQRIYRINYAKSIKEFCQKQQSLLKPESMDCGPHARKFMELTERQRENGKVPTMAKNEFFKEYTKNVLEKNKNEPGANNPQIDNKNLQNNKIQRHSHANTGKERKTMGLS